MEEDDGDDAWVAPVVITIVLLFLIGVGLGIFFFMKKMKARGTISPNKTPISPLPQSTQMTDIAKNTTTAPQQATKETGPDLLKEPKSLPNLATSDNEQMGMESILPSTVGVNNGQGAPNNFPETLPNGNNSGSAANLKPPSSKLSGNYGIAGLNNTGISRNSANLATRDEINNSLEVGSKGKQ